MPYKSLDQERYFHANKSKLEKEGVDVKEWDQASKGMKLPKKASVGKTLSDCVSAPKGKGC